MNLVDGVTWPSYDPVCVIIRCSWSTPICWAICWAWLSCSSVSLVLNSMYFHLIWHGDDRCFLVRAASVMNCMAFFSCPPCLYFWYDCSSDPSTEQLM